MKRVGSTRHPVATVDPGWRRTLAFIGMSLFVVAAGWVVALWFQLAVSVVRPESSLPIGRDFAVFYTGASLAEDGDWHSLYDVEEFQQEYDRITGLNSPVGGPVFRYPPPTALALAPLTHLPLKRALVLWTTLTFAGSIAALKAARVSLPIAAAVMVTVPGFLTVALGQNTFLTLLLLLAALALLNRGRSVAAGVVLGLLVLKPQFLIGVIVWLVSSPRNRRRELVGTALGGGAILIGSVPLALDGWKEFLGSIFTLSQPPNTLGRPYFSGLDFLRFLVGNGNLALALWVGLVCGLIWLFVRVFRSNLQDPAVGLALAVLASILLSPHLVSYDWLLLVVPGVVLWRHFTRIRPLLIFSVGALSVAALVTPEVVSLMLAHFGWAFSLAFPLLLVMALAVIRMIGTTSNRVESLDQHVS